MPLLRLIAEGVGPFEKVDIDLSDGKGKPHLGPHILAGVNGSGKSTILRTLAWVMDRGGLGFQHDDWFQLLEGHPQSRAVLVLRPEGAVRAVQARFKGGRSLKKLAAS
jgi:ABC-type sulfate/molybdate transport systems ATPase subunit